jgi:hypothetical protein
VDERLASEEIEAFLKEIDFNYAQMKATRQHYPPEREASDASLRRHLPTMQRIADELEPRLGDQLLPRGVGWLWYGARDAAQRMQGILAARTRLAEILGPAGPSLSARSLHPLVWNAAAALYDGGHRRNAVTTAWLVLEQNLKAKLGVNDLTGKDLVDQAFSRDAPKPGRPRLRFLDFQARTEDWTSAHSGAGNFARGCVQRIRNLSDHRTDEPSEAVALEQLAALSLLARWIDEAIVETA